MNGGRMTSVGIKYHREEDRLHKTGRSHYVVYLYNLMSLKTFKKNNKIYQDLVLLKRENTIYVENITVIVFVFKNVQGFDTYFFALTEITIKIILGFWYNDKNIFTMFPGKVSDQNVILNGPVRSC